LALSNGRRACAVLQKKGEDENEYDGEPRLFISLLLINIISNTPIVSARTISPLLKK
jgi:hypothetical protein